MQQINYSRVIENAEELELYQVLTVRTLRFLVDNGAATFGQIIRYVGGSDRRMLRLLNELVKGGAVTFKEGYFRLPDARPPRTRQLDFLCPSCHGVVVNTTVFESRTVDLMRKIISTRPKTTFIFDQRPVTLDTTLRRAAYMAWRGDIHNLNIAVVGDDDLTSIAIALTDLAKSVTVFEVDARLVDYIHEVAEKYRLRLKCVNLDITQGIPDEFVSAFDVFTTDPTPTKIPFVVFVNAGIQLLGDNGGIGYLSFYSSAMELSIDLQEVLTQMRLTITDLIPHFTEYDFVKETYSQDDTLLLEKYADGISEMCFYEHLCRVVKSRHTRVLPLDYVLSDMQGKATRRVLADISLDPATVDEHHQEYLKQMAQSVGQNIDKKMKTGAKDGH